MLRRCLPFAMLTFLSLILIPSVVQAATITSCTFDKEIYHQGETGNISVTIYNDHEERIRITELTGTINYYYVDETVYIQKFYSDTTLPVEILSGDSDTLNIPFSLPTNIAAGYTKIDVKAKSEVWNPQAERWYEWEHSSYQPLLNIESPYVQRYEDKLAQNEGLMSQIDELEKTNANTTSMMYMFGGTTAVFAAVAAFMWMLWRKARFFKKPIA